MCQFVALSFNDGDVEVLGIRDTRRAAEKIVENGYNAQLIQNEDDRWDFPWGDVNALVKRAEIGQSDTWFEVHEVKDAKE